MPDHPQDAGHSASRRALLRRAAGLAGALASTGALSMVEAVAASYGNMAKTTVGYQLVPKGNQACGNCALFIPSSSPDGGRCKSVAGVINPQGWCHIWAPEKGLRSGSAQPA